MNTDIDIVLPEWTLENVMNVFDQDSIQSSEFKGFKSTNDPQKVAYFYIKDEKYSFRHYKKDDTNTLENLWIFIKETVDHYSKSEYKITTTYKTYLPGDSLIRKFGINEYIYTSTKKEKEEK